MSLSLAGLREDGRRAGEMRQIGVKMGLGGACDGSAYFEMGQTRVLCEVVGPHEGRRGAGAEAHERAQIVVEYCLAPFAGLERKRRRAGDRQGVELALAVQQSLASSVLVASYPNTQINVFLTVLQDDGGRLPACINAATLALVDAGVAMSDLLVACSAGMVQVGARESFGALACVLHSRRTRFKQRSDGSHAGSGKAQTMYMFHL